MEGMLGISLYSCLYPKLAKTICLSYYLLCFLFNKIREVSTTGLPGSVGTGDGWRGDGWRVSGEVSQTIYTHVSKCKSYNKKEKEKK
jgi:hypothetical protein